MVGVSPDSRGSHRRFREALQLPFPLVADTKKLVIKLYGVQRTIGIMPTRRETYLIDKAGIIRGLFQHELAIGKHQSEVLDGLKRLNTRVKRA